MARDLYNAAIRKGPISCQGEWWFLHPFRAAMIYHVCLEVTRTHDLRADKTHSANMEMIAIAQVSSNALSLEK